MTTATYYVKHSHGTTTRHASWEDAIAGLREVYGDDLVAYDTEGWECSDGEPAVWDGRVLVWRDEQSSVDDDGARAVASISRYS